jgi:hypothetical protein
MIDHRSRRVQACAAPLDFDRGTHSVLIQFRLDFVLGSALGFLVYCYCGFALRWFGGRRLLCIWLRRACVYVASACMGSCSRACVYVVHMKSLGDYVRAFHGISMYVYECERKYIHTYI